MEEHQSLLATIESPEALRRLPVSALELLAAEIRETLLEVVSRTGGHLAPSLGVVELTLALHYVFDTPRDQLVWDVGHQAYVHKLLTGRRDFFRTLRSFGGCSGFPLPAESPEFDPVGGGHAGVAISAALGLARAAELAGTPRQVVAVVGDGSLNCGISLEGLNNIRSSVEKLVVVLNDNKMSISANVGAIPGYLNRIITGKSYSRFKALAHLMLRKLPRSEEVRRSIQMLENATKSLFLPGGFFEEMGIRYLGPINGHDFPALLRSLEAARDYHRPVLLHVITEKGRGYEFAEREPARFHGIGPFDRATGEPKKHGGSTFSAAFGATMVELGRRTPELQAITAAMTDGTGLAAFAREFPERFHDVGIAEEHAVVFAGGLAAGGQRPVVAIYSSFMQRAFDNIFHDVLLQNLPVVLALDRAGVVEDGPTHHGIYDLAFLRALPNLTLMAPRSEDQLRDLLHLALKLHRPVAIRYPRGGTRHGFDPAREVRALEPGRAEMVRSGRDLALWALGPETDTALDVAELLSRDYQLEATVVNTLFLKPFDVELARSQAARMPLFTLEDHRNCGGLASVLRDEAGIQPRRAFGWPDRVIPHGNVHELRTQFGLTPETLAPVIAAALSEPTGQPNP